MHRLSKKKSQFDKGDPKFLAKAKEKSLPKSVITSRNTFSNTMNSTQSQISRYTGHETPWEITDYREKPVGLCNRVYILILSKKVCAKIENFDRVLETIKVA